MDLEYPTHKNVDIIKQLNRLDKLTSKLNLTLKDVPQSETISKHQKQKIIKLISADQPSIFKYLDKEVITIDRELGSKGSRWNLLHVCAKYDAVQIAKKLLKTLFQQDRGQYLRVINSQTAEGYTALMISIIYQANKMLELLLRLGGSDLSIIQSSKLRAYDLALNYHNEKAIQELIVYEDRCRKQMYINEKELTQEDEEKNDQTGWCHSIANYLLDCLLCLNKEEHEDENQGLMSKINNFIGNVDEKEYAVDSVKIGSRKDIEDYEIQWKKLSSLQGQKFVLFDSFKPLDISQNQFSLRHNLILFQALSDYSWILKKCISKHQDKSKPKSKEQLQKYCLNLYKNFSSIKLEVDECVPFVKERGEVMFLSNQNEIWPMILQKGLAKLYSSYLQLNSLSITDTIEDITGFYTKSIPITSFRQNTLVSTLQQLNMRGNLILLQSNDKTEINPSGISNSYSILNFYQKGNTKKILVNCPNVLERWKEPKENRQLAIIKTHFNKHNQSCVWIDECKLDYYFKNVVICYLKENFSRSELKIKMKIKGEDDCSNKDFECQNGKITKQYKKAIFFRFKLDKAREEPIYLQLIDMETKLRYDLTQLAGWKNEGLDILIHDSESEQCKELVKLTCEAGQYMCMYEISTKKILPQVSHLVEPNKSIIRIKKQAEEQLKSQATPKSDGEEKKKVKLNLGPEHLKELMLLNWSIDPLQLEYLEEELGTIEWLSHFKNYSILNWQDLIREKKQEDCFVYETVNQKTLLLINCKQVKKIFLQLQSADVSWGHSESIIQGKYAENQTFNSIELVRQAKSPSFFYMVAGNFPIEMLQKQRKIRFIYQYE